MLETQPIVSPRSSRIIQGTRQKIAEELKKLDDQEELTLIIPGKQDGQNGASASPLRSFEEVFGPLQKGFEQSGMTEEELNDFVDAEMKAYREERRAKEAAPNE